MTTRHSTAIVGLLAAAALSCGGDDSSPPGVEVPPGTEVIIEEGPARLVIPAGEHFAREGEGLTPFRVEVTVEDDDAEVELREHEVPLSPIVSVMHGEEGEIPIVPLPDSTDRFGRLSLELDASALPEAVAADDLNDFNVIVVARHPRDTQGPEPDDGWVTSRVVGEVDPEAGRITIALSALPERLDLRAAYTPSLIAIAGEPDPGGLDRLTREPPWEAVTATTVADAMGSELLARVTQLRGSATPSDVEAVLEELVVANVEASARFYEGLGLRQPNLEFRALRAPGAPAGTAFVVHVDDYEGSAYHWGATPFPQLQIDLDRLDDGPETRLGTVRASIHHELFHASFHGYEIAKRLRSTRGADEGLATVLGHSFDRSTGRAEVRSGGSAVYDLDGRFLDYDDGRYANQEVLAYLARSVMGDSFGFLGGSEGWLDAMRVAGQALRDAAAADPSLVLGPDDFRRAYLAALDEVVRNATGNEHTLHDIYDAFVRNRFWEHDEDSQLREGDSDPPGTPRPDRFDDPFTFTVDEDGVSRLSASFDDDVVLVPNLVGLRSMEATLLVVEAGAAGGGTYAERLQLDFELVQEFLIPDGVRIHVYPEGGDGVTLDEPRFVDEQFGAAHPRLYVLIVNTSVEGSAELEMTVTAGSESAPSIEGRAEVQTDGGIEPLGSAAVGLSTLGGDLLSNTFTDGNGRFVFDDLEAGDYLVEVIPEDFESQTQTVTVEDGRTARPVFRFERGGGGEYGIRGSVYADGDETPIAGAAVTVLQPDGTVVGSATTDATGAYPLIGVPASGTYVQRVEADGFASETVSHTISLPEQTRSFRLHVRNQSCSSDMTTFELLQGSTRTTNFADFVDEQPNDSGTTDPSAAILCVNGTASTPSFSWDEEGFALLTGQEQVNRIHLVEQGGSEPDVLFSVTGPGLPQPFAYGDTSGDWTVNVADAPPLRGPPYWYRLEVRTSTTVSFRLR